MKSLWKIWRHLRSSRKSRIMLQTAVPQYMEENFNGGNKMFLQEDNSYNDIRQKSLNQWLDEMEKHEDIAVRGGVKLTREYIQYLNDEINRLKEENALKNEYLKKMSKRQ